MGSAIFRRISAQNLFQHLIISCCNAPTQRTKIPMLPGKYAEQDSSYERQMGSTIFRRVSAWNLFFHMIVSWCIERTERTKNSETARKMYRKTFLVSSSNGKCHFSEDFRPKPLPTSHNFLLRRSYAKNKNSDAARKIYRTRFFVCASSGKYHFSVGFLHETCSSLS